MKRLRICFVPMLLCLACENEPRSANYSVVLEDAAGLKTGAGVFIAGVGVGRVNNVQLEGKRARVHFDLRSAAGLEVTAATCVSVGFHGVGNPAHLSVDPGQAAGATIAPGGELTCVRGNAIAASTESVMKKAEQLLATALGGKGLVSRLLHDKELADKVARHFEQLDANATGPKASEPATAPEAVKKAPKPTGGKAPAPKVAPDLSVGD